MAGAAPQRPIVTRERAVVAAIGVLATLRALAFLIAPMTVDEREHFHSAWLVLQGQAPHADFFQHHNATLWYVLAGIAKVVGSNGPAIMYAGRAIAAAAFFVGLIAVWRMAKSTAAWSAPLIACAYVMFAENYLFELRPELVAVPLGLYLIHVVLAGADRWSHARTVAVGAATLILIALTPRAAGFLVELGVAAWFTWRTARLRLAVAIGAGVVGGLVIVVVLAGGVANYVDWVIRFSAHLKPLVGMRPYFVEVHVVPPLIALAFAIASNRARPTRVEIVTDLLFAVSIVLVVLERRIYGESFAFVFVTGFASMIASCARITRPWYRVGLAVVLAAWLGVLAIADSSDRAPGRITETFAAFAHGRFAVVTEVNNEAAICAAHPDTTVYITQAYRHPFCAINAGYYWFGATLITRGTPLPDDAPSYCAEFARFRNQPTLDRNVFFESERFCESSR